MRIDIEIVTGFIGAGKTTFINALLKNTIVKNEKVVVILCEKGNTPLNEGLMKSNTIVVKNQEPLKTLTSEYLKNVINLYSPHRIIIEYNGTRSLEELANELNDTNMRRLCKVSTIFHITEAETFKLFFFNMNGYIEPCIRSSNLILINHVDKITESDLLEIKNIIGKINHNAFILDIKDNEEIEFKLKNEKVLDGGFMKKLRLAFKNAMG